MRKICIMVGFCLVGLLSTNNMSAKNSTKADSFKNFSSNEIAPYMDDFDCIAAITLWGDAVTGYAMAPADSPDEASYFLLMNLYAEMMDAYCN